MSPTNQPTQEQLDEWKEGFSLYDKKGNSTVSSANLGDLLRGLGQNPTQAEVLELVKSVGGSERQEVDIDFGTFLTILTRPDGFKPAGTSQEFIQGFQVFDKEGDGTISAGELRYVLTNLGEKLSEEEVDELLKEVQVGKDGRINYVDFVTLILSNWSHSSLVYHSLSSIIYQIWILNCAPCCCCSIVYSRDPFASWRRKLRHQH